jgi:hypothetical protein
MVRPEAAERDYVNVSQVQSVDRGAVDERRVEDAEAKAEKRAKAAYQSR